MLCRLNLSGHMLASIPPRRFHTSFWDISSPSMAFSSLSWDAANWIALNEGMGCRYEAGTHQRRGTNTMSSKFAASCVVLLLAASASENAHAERWLQASQA